MFATFHFRIWYFVILTSIKKSQHKTGCKKTNCSLRNSFLCNHAMMISIKDMKICISTVQITPCIQCHCCRLHWRTRNHMVFMKIPYCPAIRNKMPFKIPLTPKFIFYKCLTATTRFTIDTIIGSHNSFHMRILYKSFESWKICLFHILLRYFGIKLMT